MPVFSISILQVKNVIQRLVYIQYFAYLCPLEPYTGFSSQSTFCCLLHQKAVHVYSPSGDGWAGALNPRMKELIV